MGRKNKAGDCRESITSDHFPFMYDLYLKYNTIKSFYAKSAMKAKKGRKRMPFYKARDLSETFYFNWIRS